MENQFKGYIQNISKYFLRRNVLNYKAKVHEIIVHGLNIAGNMSSGLSKGLIKKLLNKLL